MFRNKQIYIFASILVIFSSSAWYYIQRQNTAFKENTYSYISTVNSLKATQIADWYADEIFDATLMAQNPYIQDFVLQYLVHGNYSQLKNFLSIIAEEHGITNIFFVDSSFSVNTQGVPFYQFDFDTVYENLREQQVYVSDIYTRQTDSLLVVDFVVSLFSQEHIRLGFLVFQHSVAHTIDKILAQSTISDVSRTTYSNVFFQSDSSIKHYCYLHESLRKYSRESFFIPYSVFDSIQENHFYNGYISKTNSLFKKQDLYVLHKIPHTDLFVYTLLPADEFYAQQIQSQIYIAIFFIVVLLLIVLLFLLLQSQKKQKVYKKLYSLQQEYKTMLYSIGDAVIVTNELGIVQNMNGIAEELLGVTESKAVKKHIDELFEVQHQKNNSSHVDIIQHVLSTGKKHTMYHAQLCTKFDSVIPIYESIAPVRDKNSDITGLVFVIHNQTQERKILLELEESNRKLESLFSNLPGMFYRCAYNLTWDMEFVSYGSTELTGYTPHEFMSKSISYAIIIHPDDSEYINITIAESLKKKASFQLEYRIICQDETVKWVWERGNGVFDANGSVIAIEGYIEDISDRKQFELALLESEEMYRKQFEDHTAIQFLIEPSSGKIINVNKAAVEYYGWNKSQFLSMKITDIDTLSYEGIVEKVAEVQNKNHTFYEFQHRKADGTVRSVEVYSSPVEIKGTVYIHSIVHDVTDKKEAFNQILLQSKAIEQSPVSIIITDNQGYIEFANTKFCEVSGYAIHEVLGKKPSVLKSGNQSSEFYENLWKTISSGNNWEGEFQNMKKTGELYWEKALITPIINPEGKIFHYVAVKEDITEKKKLLEDLVSAKEKAEESDRLKSAFLANMSHEIRTPMNGIIGFAEFFKDPYLSYELRKKYAEIVVDSSKQLLAIVNDILDISRIESNTLHINSETVSINGLVQEIADFFAPQMQQKELTLLISNGLDDANASIISDKARIKQIITNLVSNAIKFTDSGSIEIGYSLKNDVLEFFVKDTGIGISEKNQNIVFERFQQVEHAQKKHYGGTSLGLAIFNKIFSLLGGSMWVESDEGNGAAFYFTIPYNFVPSEQKQNDIQTSHARKNQVLVAEDDDTNFLYIQTVLLLAQVEVIRAHNGKEAVELIHANPQIQVVFMDVKMPVMNGFDASKEILHHNSEISIVILSAFDLEDERAIAKEIGCYDYVAKPIKKDKVLQILAALFSK